MQLKNKQTNKEKTTRSDLQDKAKKVFALAVRTQIERPVHNTGLCARTGLCAITAVCFFTVFYLYLCMALLSIY